MYTGGCATRSPRSTPARDLRPARSPVPARPVRPTPGAEPTVAGVARRRLDAELVRRKLARSREHAEPADRRGRVTVGGTTATKSATQVETSAPRSWSTRTTATPTTSRAAATSSPARWRPSCPRGLTVEGRRALDAGRLHRRLHRCLLRAGAAHVVAVDVGYGQLAWSLQSDERVTVKDRTNVRELTLEAIDGEPVDLVVGDLSFIPLGLVLPALVRCAAPDADLVLMVKPQFEVGKERLGSGGVVRSPSCAPRPCAAWPGRRRNWGSGVLGVTASPLPGPVGECRVLSVAARRGARTGPGRCRPCSGGGAALTTDTELVLFSCSPTPAGRRPSAAPSSSSRGCCAAASACGSSSAEAADLPLPPEVELVKEATPECLDGLRAADRARRRRDAAARRRVRPRLRGADARRQPRAGRLPRRGRARRPRQGRRPGGDAARTRSRSG